MQLVTLRENTSLKLNDKYLTLIESIIKDNPDIPLKIDREYLIFDEYIVGSLQIEDLKIEIQPRHNVFTAESIFEMLFYSPSLISY